MVSASPTDVDQLRTGCGLVDRSERGKLALTGPEAAGLLSGQVTNEIEALEVGAGCYAALLSPKGKMLTDLRVLRRRDELHLDCERVGLQALFDTLRRAGIGWDAVLHKRTLQEALLSLVGPAAGQVTGTGELGPSEHDHVDTTVGGVAVLAVRTDVGVDLLCAADDAERLREALGNAGIHAVDPAAAEILRVERGRPRFGADLDGTVIPQEAGLNDRAVSFTKGCYVGQETVARLRWKGKPNRHLRHVVLDGPAASGDALLLGGPEGKHVGTLGTVVHSPRLGHVALALVRREAAIGDELVVGDGSVRGTVTELPRDEGA